MPIVFQEDGDVIFENFAPNDKQQCCSPTTVILICPGMRHAMLSYPNDVVSGLFEQAEHVCLPDSALRSVTASRLRDWWWREAESGLPRKQRFDVLEQVVSLGW